MNNIYIILLSFVFLLLFPLILFSLSLPLLSIQSSLSLIIPLEEASAIVQGNNNNNNKSDQLPIAIISPKCGETEDQRINLTVNSFKPNGNVYWEFIDSEGEKGLYGYFKTNQTGGFNEYTFAEQLESDTYTVRFFDDKNNDYVPDPKGAEFLLKYPVPCEE